MFDKVLKFILPHHCCKCQKVGLALCQDCKNHIILQRKDDPKLTIWQNSATNLRCFGWRRGLLEKIVDDYKFKLHRELAGPLAELVVTLLSDLSGEVIIVPIPTTKKHNRARGFDHMKLIAKEVARLKSAQFSPLLLRANQISQRGLARSKRLENAKISFRLASVPIVSAATYVVLDDVFTTGATLNAASELLREAGAKKVLAVVICRQPNKK